MIQFPKNAIISKRMATSRASIASMQHSSQSSLQKPLGNNDVEDAQQLSNFGANIGSPYQATVTKKDVVKSSSYKMNSSSGLQLHKKDIIKPEIDVKNKVLKDKRKALIQVLKDKRPAGLELLDAELMAG